MDTTELTTTSLVYPVIAVFVTIYLAFQLAKSCQKALGTDLRRIPGPWYTPWSRLWLKVHIIKGERCQHLHSLHLKYGEFVRISPDEVSISNLDAFKTIHRAGSGFNKSDWYKKFNPGPPGIFAMTDPKQHSVRRRLFAQPFSNSSVQTYESAITAKVQLAVSKIKRDAQVGLADVLKWFTFMATDVSGELGFGSSFDMLQQERKSEYIHDLETALTISGIRVEMGPLVALAKRLFLTQLQHAFSVDQRLDSYGKQAIANLRMHASSSANSTSMSIFARMIDRTKTQDLSPEEIEHEASNLIVAGSDTTAISLTYAIWSLLRPTNRLSRERLTKEVADAPANPSPNEIATLPYLNAVIKEALRLYGAAPGSLPRIVPKDGVMLGEYIFPAGTTVSTQAYTMHRDPNVFSNPESFDPQRWLSPAQAMNDAFSPFGVGARTCLGIHLAMLELRVGLFVFLRECPTAELAPSTTDESMDFVNYFLIAPKGGKCEVTLLAGENLSRDVPRLS